MHWANTCDKVHKTKYLYTSFLNGGCNICVGTINLLGGFPMLPISFLGSSFVCFLLLLPWSLSCISSKKGILEGWEKGIVRLIPPSAAQCFSFVKAEGAEFPVCTHAEICCCPNVETFGGKRWIFLPAFHHGEVIQYLAAFLSMPLTWCFTDLFAQIPLDYTLFSL